MLRIKDVMKNYNVSKTTVYNWIKQGLPIIKVGRITFIEKENLEKFIKKGD